MLTWGFISMHRITLAVLCDADERTKNPVVQQKASRISANVMNYTPAQHALGLGLPPRWEGYRSKGVQS